MEFQKKIYIIIEGLDCIGRLAGILSVDSPFGRFFVNTIDIVMQHFILF